MLPTIVLLLIVPVFGLPPPDGLNLKRAKQIGEEDHMEPPPNLQLRSRMMAAMNSHIGASTDKTKDMFNQPLILSKSKKTAKPVKSEALQTTTTTETTNIETNHSARLSPEQVRQKFTSSTNERVNLKVRPVLTTNFVDANGRVVKDVVSIPIRVSDGHIHAISKNGKGEASVDDEENDADKNVNVSFRSSLPLWLI